LKVNIVKFLNEGVWIVIGQIFSILGSLIFIKVVTSELNSSDYGLVSLVLSISIFFSQVIFGSIGSAVSRFFSVADSKQDFIGYYTDSKRIVFKVSICLLIAGFVLSSILFFNKNDNLFYFVILITFISIFNGVNSVLSNFQNAARQRIVVAMHNGLGAISKIFISIWVFKTFGSSELSLFKSIFISSFIVLLSQILFFKFLWYDKNINKLSVDSPSGWSKDIWNYSLSFSIWNGFVALYQLSDKWALNQNSSLQEVGVYSVLFQLGFTPISLVISSLLSFLSPIIFEKVGDGKDLDKNRFVDDFISKIILVIFILTISGFILVSFFHELIFSFLVGVSYYNSSSLLPYYVLAGGIFSAGQVLNLKMESKIKIKEMTIIKTITAVLGIVLNFFLTFIYGFIGILLSLIIYSIINFLSMLYFSFDFKKRFLEIIK